MQLPDLATPKLTARTLARAARSAFAADAIVYVVAGDAAPAFAALPEPTRWQALHRRSRPEAPAVRTTTLSNAVQSTAVLAYAPRRASSFERLSLAGRVMRALHERRPARIALAIDSRLPEAALWAEALLAAACAHSFALASFRSSPARPWRLRSIELYSAARVDLKRCAATARANNLARWLTALPPNKLDPAAYHRLLAQLARQHALKFRWYSEADLKRLGAGAFLAVSQGNAHRGAGIACLSTGGARTAPDVALIGKGITFDTGGTNLKSHRSMLDMHTDMGGSAVALATVLALKELGSPLKLACYLAITDNSMGPGAYRPQDVVQALNGTRIQVIHTDAEGRMVLADALALAARSKPGLMLDFATLTGACVYALTERYSGIFSNRPALAAALVAAGSASGERLWSFPLDADFDGDIESKVADIAQCAVEGKGDHIHAARFLQRFVPRQIPWAHMDLSAASRNGGLAHIPTDVTGFGVRCTLELLLSGEWRRAARARQNAA
ncbi:MAG: leucyl aminopeptidase family protein [Steroidobacteraceae bacterium]